ncbi:hypothetical protein GEV33_002447 [Tenebrio molitor]|uniref:Gustatory receptor n=1 Tax=Tenebrio molitor TaxID=7067 RepID=A0A8J6LEU5_TENMO|nr:hypothetical protein GEV33_002447 [Tenebrio molitor]
MESITVASTALLWCLVMEISDLNILSVSFAIGKLLAVTPHSLDVKQNRRCQKIYSLFMCTAITVGLSVTYCYRIPFYKKFDLIKLTIHVLLDICLYAFNFYTTIVVTFCREQQWQVLVSNLQTIECTTPKHFFIKWFAVANVLYWALMLGTIWTWIVNFGVEYYKQYVMDAVQLYSKFIYIYLICAILNMFLKRYREIRRLIKNIFSENDNHLVFIKVKYNILGLRQSVEAFNQIFGWPILFVILYSCLRILIYMDLLIDSQKNLGIGITIVNVGILVVLFVGSVVIIVSCDAILEEGETIVRLLSKYRYCANGGRNDEVKMLSGMMKDNFPEFSAARFFWIDRTTIFGILQSITTFFIILIQFNFA